MLKKCVQATFDLIYTIAFLITVAGFITFCVMHKEIIQASFTQLWNIISGKPNFERNSPPKLITLIQESKLSDKVKAKISLGETLSL